MQTILKNFSSYFDTLFSFNRKLSENIFNLYSSSEEHSPFSEILTKIHVDNNRAFQTKLKEINSIIDSTSSWEKYLSNLPFLLKEKEDARKNYDHYEKKMLQLIEERKKIEKKGTKASGTFMEKLQRNEEKFIKAKNEYLTKAVNAFDHLETKIKDRFQLTSEVLLRLFTVESKIYSEFNENFSRNDNLREMQLKIEQV